MRNAKRCVKRVLMILFTLSLVAGGAAAQQREIRNYRGKIELGRGMSFITADLMQVAAQSDLFLRFGGKINLTREQQKKLEELYFEIQQYSLRREADLAVADAELRRLMSNDRVDLVAVRAKVKEIEAIQSEATMKNIETALQAISALTHEQHLKVMLLVRDLIEQKMPPPQTAPQG